MGKIVGMIAIDKQIVVAIEGQNIEEYSSDYYYLNPEII